MANLKNIDSNKVFKYIQTQVAPNKINNTNMELTLAIMALAHVENSNKFFLGFNSAVVGGSLLGGIATSIGTFGVASVLTLGIGGTVGLIKNSIRYKKIKNLQEELETYLTKRYDNPMEAYCEIYKLILAINTEQLVEYLENASK